MNRKELINYIKENYNAEPECLWIKYPNYIVFRHNSNSKWFAAIMDVLESKLSDNGSRNMVDVINLKVMPNLTGSLRLKKGVYPAYHMNKEHWISISLSSEFDDNELKSLISESYNLTQ
ncbi:MmcQ/YjbR family DNA-binding protein [Proteus cibarius]|uniref:MmcQ/YjbR family DNA-binding protein n=1 Tax=Proteus terrae subsp. cibarius TaxID=626774 RepID=A0A6G6SV91_9GAMM|nr:MULTISPECIES: MmcQ/YjbR family DNA-binding protein [Proteus]QHP75943.1 MmcQ/YjbR family DNA-binding protein [Proteus vulgaris]MBG2915129.1 MmcQ/YjbR family DNA-binding protein [Proteus terrae subsp. cibarius]MBG3089423.1 MmcQ/YjbR family DNA-binding protein [Proteus terrae subsp. cibarius]MBG6039255.1 MmcQ/YjbR family DNA-binding protein [Proteus terrae subsp. cibarius]MCM2365699.1 MmcQ/YjbR family DNA-binding protein [Proteus sp. FZP2095]